MSSSHQQQGFAVRLTSANGAGQSLRPLHEQQAYSQPQSTSPSDIYEDYQRSPPAVPAQPSHQSLYAGMQEEPSSYPHFGANAPPPAAPIQSQTQMYPVDLGTRVHKAMKPSIDADVTENLQDDNASVHSRSHLNGSGGTPTHGPGLRARFDSSQPMPQGKHANGSPLAATDFAEKPHSGFSKDGQRSLPAGYQTPPSFSRASSGWSARALNSVRGHTQGGSSGSGDKHPYGNLRSPASVSDPALQFAQGDYANSAFARFWLMIVSKNIVIRWLAFILPVLLLLWIPGICGFTIHPTPRVWKVSLVNWSIWLSIVWVGWWAAMIVAMVGPHILRKTIGSIAPEARHYIDYLFALKKTLTAFLWTLAMWISFQPLILSQGPSDHGTGTGLTLSQMTKGLFAFWICSIILLVEKLVIQVIAYNFHSTSYADRIAENKFAVKSLVVLYLNSRDIGRSDTLDGGMLNKEKIDPAKLLRKGLKSAKRVVTGATTALGTVASEIVGERVLQPNSPQSMVTSALASAQKSRQLARRIFFSYTPSSRHVMHKEDIAAYFPNQDHLSRVYAVFDKDENGDVSLEEIEMACLEVHRERQSLASSMRDLDSAVARLDQIFVSLWYIVSILIIIGLVSISFSSFVTTGATFVLGLSWLIGGTSQEVLSAIIFLLAKHPYDVSDLVTIDGYDGSYIVKEISLLSTIFKKTDGNIVQIPHTVLNTKAIFNARRSGPTSESVTWDVDFGTTFEKIEELRGLMVEFVEHESRDFLPTCDISVVSFTDQSKMTLSASIPFKSNWSNSALKSQRRNKWICALKIGMGQLSIFGPGGAGNPSPAAADPQVIRILNPEAAAPPYRSPTSSAPSHSPHNQNPPTTISSPPLAGALPSERGSPSLAQTVNRLDLSSRDVVSDPMTDIFDYEGDANREETLNLGEAEHAAQVQLQGNNTALNTQPSEEGARLNRFRQQDLELGKIGNSGAGRRT